MKTQPLPLRDELSLDRSVLAHDVEVIQEGLKTETDPDVKARLTQLAKAKAEESHIKGVIIKTIDDDASKS